MTGFITMTALRVIISMFLLVLSLSALADDDKYNKDGKKVTDLVDISIGEGTISDLLPPGAMDGPKESDVMRQMLVTLLGSPVVNASKYFENSSGTVDANGFTTVTYYASIMTGLALLVSALLYAYIMYGGLMNTASDGKFLGEKWHSMWVPMRSGLGLAALYPSKALGGLSIVQLMVIVLALLGIGLASAIFYAVSVKMMSNPIILPNIPSQQYVASHVLRGQVCTILKKGSTNVGSNKLVTKPKTYSTGIVSGDVVVERTSTKFEFGDNDCGGLLHNSISSYNSSGADFMLIKGLSPLLAKATSQAVSSLYKLLMPIAQELSNIESNTPLSDADYSRLASQYKTALYLFEVNLRSVLKDEEIQKLLAESNSTILKSTSELGFAMAGTFYYSWARYQDQLNELVETNKLKTTGEVIWANNKLINTIRGYKEHVAKSSFQVNAMLKATSEIGSLEEGIDTVVNTEQSALGWASSEFASNMAIGLTSIGRFGGASSKLNPDPIMDLKALGHVIINSYISVTLLAATTFSVADTTIAQIFSAGTSQVVADMARAVFQLLTTWSVPIVAIGFVYANLLPAMPYIMWTTSMAGYLIYVIEAIYSAPFWAAMHITPDGHEITGKGASGYPILMTLVLRPSFMVGGLIAAMAIVRLMGWFLNQTLFESMRSMGVGSFNLTSLFGTIIVYGIALSSIIYKAFSLTHELPNAMLRWMGVGQHHADLGEAQAMEKSNAAIGVVAQHVTPTKGATDKTPKSEGGGGEGGGEGGGSGGKASGNLQKAAGDEGNSKT